MSGSDIDRTFLKQAELDQAGRYLVEHFKGLTLSEIRKQLLQMLMEEKSLYDRLLKTVVLLGAASLVKCEGDDDEESQVYLGGASSIIQNPVPTSTFALSLNCPFKSIC